MWIVCGTASVLFCVLSWCLVLNRKPKAIWASVCSVSFVALTLLMQYRLVLDWINKGDWSALTDVVPGMFPVLSGYVIVMLLANGISVVLAMVTVKNNVLDQ